MSATLIQDREQLRADLETRRSGAAHYLVILTRARALRDSDICRGAAVLSQDRAERAERCRRYLVAVGEMADDRDDREQELADLFVAHRPRGMSELTARTMIRALSAAASAAVDEEQSMRAPVSPLPGYADMAALEARIAEIDALLRGEADNG